MWISLEPGPLSEPATARHWDAPTVRDQVRRRTAFLASRGLSRGDRVMLHYGNCLEIFVDLLAVWSLGGCAVPIDTRLTPFEIETLAGAARPRLSLWLGEPDADVSAALSALGVDSVDVSPAERFALTSSTPPRSTVALDQDALILFTSGTTGQPKGVVHTHRSLGARWTALRQALGIAPYRRSLCLLPTHFGHGLICNSLYPWLSGQHLFILPPFRADVLSRLGPLIDEHEITFLSSVPSVWRLALRTSKPPAAASLERIFCGSAPLSAHLWEEIRRWSGVRDVWNAYGITETGSWLAGTSIADFTPEDGLVGPAWGGVLEVLRSDSAATELDGAERCAPGDSGHVWVNTPALMRGYLQRDDLTAEVVTGGWFRTGDIGFLDDRGCLYLRGRQREEINKGGMKVYPSDIDSVVERFPGVTDVCAFPIEDRLLGEEVAIALVLRSGDAVSLGQLREWMARHLARHQMPKRWYVVEEIPRTSRGKINRALVGERCASLEPVDPRWAAGRSNA